MFLTFSNKEPIDSACAIYLTVRGLLGNNIILKRQRTKIVLIC